MTDINKTIHEKLFGARWLRSGYSGKRLLIAANRCEAMEKHHGFVEADGTEEIEESGLFPVLDYESNIADAFKVVEELEKKGFCWQMSNTDDFTTPSINHYVEVWKGQRSEGVYFDKSLPLAICRAALKVLEVENESLWRRY